MGDGHDVHRKAQWNYFIARPTLFAESMIDIPAAD